ncbi:MAG: hypothetical protein D6731_04430 [Planctomycetota bacterium]|nr:MAG: hypothetical protein D6731_04430 [Planctomycetota bacterium]
MDRSHLVIAFLAGTCVALATALVLQSGNTLPQAYAQASGSGEMVAVTGTGTSQQGRDVLFLVDAANTRLLVYEYKDGRLNMAAVRNFEYETRFQEWAPPGRDQKPSVKEMRNLSEESGGKKRRRR